MSEARPTLQAPFPWFGGKSRAAALIWARLGDVPNYVEPFFGSGAVLLGRPTVPGIETINDKDAFVCLGETTRVLMGDLRYKTAGTVEVGDTVVAFDEHNPGIARPGLRAPTAYRRWGIGTVQHAARVLRPSYRLTFDDGTVVIASEDHQWLGGSHRSGGRGWRWITTKNMVANRENQCSWVLKAAPMADRDETWDAGWMGGFFDGEGHLTGATGWHLGVSQNEGGALDRAIQWMAKNKFATTIITTRKCRFLRINGGMHESLRFLMLTRPERLISKAVEKLASGRASLYGRDHRVVALIRKEFIGNQEVIAIGTDTRTFIAEGLASHNCNFWRALSADPEKVAEAASWPVNEADQHARHIWLVQRREETAARVMGDPTYYDVQIAGWWVWGICCWIGAGWCSGDGPWTAADGKLVHLGNAGCGVHRQLVHLGNAGQGVHRQHDGLAAWFRALADRLRGARVCCGDWRRVLGPTPTVKLGMTGVVLDPPYATDAGRAGDLYATDDHTISAEVRAWAIEHGDDPLLRIALCGYDTEHQMPPTWERVTWKAKGGYGSQGNGQGRENAVRETVWFSPACLRSGQPVQAGMFPDTAGEDE